MGEHIIKCRGLPWSTTAKDIVSFFHDCTILNGESGVHLPLDKTGRASGECFVQLASAQDVQTAKSHDKEHMGSRYVEVNESDRQEMDWAMNRGGSGGSGGFGGGSGSEFVVKLRGLPYSATKKDIVDFFSDIQVNQYGITISMGNDGRPSGEAFVELTSPDDVEKACAKNRETIGSRYIEIFKSNKQEIQFATSNSGGGGYGGGGGRGGGPMSSRGGGRGRSGPYDRPSGQSSSHGAAHALGPSGFNTAGMVTRGGGRGSRGGRGGSQMGGGDSNSGAQPSTTGFMIHMRGLPFEATQGDVFKFFAPLNPVEVRILYEDSGRAKGQCDVDFASYADVESAMQKDKQNMGHRYIELFNRTDDNAPRGPPGGGWGNNNSGPMLPQNRNGPNGGWNNGNNGPPQPPNMQQGGYGGGYGQGGGGGFNNMGGGYGGGYGGGNNNGFGGYNSGPPQQNPGYGGNFDNKQGFQMPQAAGGNFY